MSTYATYAYYTGVYLGTKVSSSDFEVLVRRASTALDRFCYNRVATVIDDGTDLDTIDKIMMATCAVVDELWVITASGQPGPIKSESLGGYSVTYADGAAASLPTIQRVKQAAAEYLDSTGLMFPGFMYGEYGTNYDTDWLVP